MKWISVFVLPLAVPTVTTPKGRQASISISQGGDLSFNTETQAHSYKTLFKTSFKIHEACFQFRRGVSLSPAAAWRCLSCSLGDSVLTAAQAAVCGQLQSSLRAVPAVPCKLVFALLYATLSSCCHTAGVDQVCLRQQQRRGKY